MNVKSFCILILGWSSNFGSWLPKKKLTGFYTPILVFLGCYWRRGDSIRIEGDQVRLGPTHESGKRFFCSFENGLLGYSESLFQKESPGGQCQFLCFWKPMSKDSCFIKNSKGYILIDPQWSWQSIDTQPWSKKTVGPSFDHPLWQHSRTRRACWRPLSIMVWWLARCFGSSLLRWRKVFVYLWRCGRNLSQILMELPKVSEVATNHWVFLRCDWSPVSSWFYYRS